MTKKAVLLINLGTPRSPSVADVRAYLKEFLMDPLVIDIPWLARWALVHLLILPRRPQASAAAYQKIWTEQGSPLRFYLEEVERSLQQIAADDYQVFSAMRYGTPSIASVMSQMKEQGFKEILLLPLYPQYSLAATESSLVACKQVIKGLAWDVECRELRHFYDDPYFIESFASVIKENTQDFPYDHLLFSFHGLPERQIKKTDRSAEGGLNGSHCLNSEGCCENICASNRDCYRAQCYATARLIAQNLGLASDRYTVCFQSRLGRTPWIKPYTDELYKSLPEKGIKRLAVACPAFVADCLETLEEIAIRGKEDWLQAGGTELRLIPSLNGSAKWVKALDALVRNLA